MNLKSINLVGIYYHDVLQCISGNSDVGWTGTPAQIIFVEKSNI